MADYLSKTRKTQLDRLLEDSWFGFGWRSLLSQHEDDLLRTGPTFEAVHAYFVKEVQPDVTDLVALQARGNPEGCSEEYLDNALFLSYQGLNAKVLDLFEQQQYMEEKLNASQ